MVKDLGFPTKNAECGSIARCPKQEKVKKDPEIDQENEPDQKIVKKNKQKIKKSEIVPKKNHGKKQKQKKGEPLKEMPAPYYPINMGKAVL